MVRAIALLVATSAAAPVLAALYEYEDGASAFDWLDAILVGMGYSLWQPPHPSSQFAGCAL